MSNKPTFGPKKVSVADLTSQPPTEYASVIRASFDPDLLKKRREEEEKVLAAATALGQQPAFPASGYLTTADKQRVAIPAGFYLVSGATGGGKSITSAAIASNYKRTNTDANDTPLTRIMYYFEARGPRTIDAREFLPEMENLLASDYKEKVAKGEEKKEMNAFASLDPSDFSSALAKFTGTESFFAAIRARYKKKNYKEMTPSMLVIDSVSLPLRQYAMSFKTTRNADGTTTKERSRSGEATMPGGFQPSDIGFVTGMEALALQANMIILGLLNNDLVPFADKLEGMSEGIISITSPGNFVVRERDTRTLRQVLLPEYDMKVGAAFLGYDSPTVTGSLLDIELE